MSQDKPASLAEILAENARLAAKPIDDTPAPRRATRAEIIAGLMNRLNSFQPVDNPGLRPVIVETEKPDCPICGGMGRIKYDVPFGDPRFGKTFPCPNVDCAAVKYHAEKRFMSQHEQFTRQFGQTLEYYEYASMSHYSDEDNRLSLRAARTFLRDGQIAGQDTIKRSLVLCGRVGTGKTYLLSAMRNELHSRGIYTAFLKIRTLLKGVQRGYSEDAELRDYQAENLLRTCPVLFIDELETGLSTGDRTDILESVIDYRCLHDLPTLIATNLEQDELAGAWNHRIQSRLIHMAWWVSMVGKTLRDTSPEMK